MGGTVQVRYHRTTLGGIGIIILYPYLGVKSEFFSASLSTLPDLLYAVLVRVHDRKIEFDTYVNKKYYNPNVARYFLQDLEEQKRTKYKMWHGGTCRVRG